jgi:hypothetical protein
MRKEMPRRCRVALSSAVAACILTLGSAGVGTAAPTGLRFASLPSRAVAGESVTVSVAGARPGASCSLQVSYGGSTQTGLGTKRIVGGRATWSWTIPDTVQANVARLTSSCAGKPKLTGRLLVVGSLVPPRLSVEKSGFSVRTLTLGGSDASFGVIIRNHSPNADALSVNVLVNFVLANDHLLGSTRVSIPVIAANSSYALGGNLGFPGAAPVTRLEIVMQVGGTQESKKHGVGLDNVVIEPSNLDAGWVGDVAGELVNTDPKLTLSDAQLSAVVFDAAGNILGGGTGQSLGSLPPGTRVVFKLLGSGFSDIPSDKAASAMVTAVPTWQQPRT